MSIILKEKFIMDGLRGLKDNTEYNRLFSMRLVINCFVIPHCQKKLLHSLKFIKNHSGQQDVLMNFLWAQDGQLDHMQVQCSS